MVAGMGTRVAVLDRQLTVADLLAARLREQPDVDTATAHTRVETLAQQVAEEPVDVLVLDWRMCDENGGLVAQLVSMAPTLRVLVIGNDATPRNIRSAVDAGAVGWLPADVTFQELLTGLRTAERGEFWVPGRVALWVLGTSAGPPVEPAAALRPLTQREREVLQGMVDGLTREQIALRLGMSPHTVRTHVHAVLHKLGVHSSLRAVAVARQAGLVTSPGIVPQQRGEAARTYRDQRR